jgi:hypothetical protein
MNERLPAIIDRTGIIGNGRAHIVPALIAAAGEHASFRFLEFFAANIRNPHTGRLQPPSPNSWPGATTAE